MQALSKCGSKPSMCWVKMAYMATFGKARLADDHFEENAFAKWVSVWNHFKHIFRACLTLWPTFNLRNQQCISFLDFTDDSWTRQSPSSFPFSAVVRFGNSTVSISTSAIYELLLFEWRLQKNSPSRLACKYIISLSIDVLQCLQLKFYSSCLLENLTHDATLWLQYW